MFDNNLTKLQIQEGIVNLFLRLNGYLTTGLIIHSPRQHKNQTEIDIIGVRFPFHMQSDRQIDCCEYLQIPKNSIDIIIGEVKSGNVKLQFNPALRENDDSIEKLISWIGVFDSETKNEALKTIKTLLTPKTLNTPDKFPALNFSEKHGTFSLRPILFSVDSNMPRKNQIRYISGPLMLEYIWNCLRPELPRDSCSTIYNYNHWGYELAPIVRYFKNPSIDKVGSIDDIYKQLNINT